MQYTKIRDVKKTMSKTQLRKLLNQIEAEESEYVLVRAATKNQYGDVLPAKMYTGAQAKDHRPQVLGNVPKNQDIYGIARRADLEVVKNGRHHNIMN